MTTLASPSTALEDSSTFVRAAGLEVTHATGDRVEGYITLGPEHHTPWGVVHGGVYTSAVETAASIGASRAVAERGQYAVGVNNTTDFVRSVTSGKALVTAKPVQQGRIQQLWDVQITDEGGRLLARGSVRLQNVEPRG